MWTIGAILGPQSLTITREQIVRYAGASEDFNPIHYDDECARSLGLPGVIAHGMLNMGLVARVLLEACPYGTRLERYGVRFQEMVRPGQQISISGTVTGLDEDEAGVVRASVAVGLTVDTGQLAVRGEAVLVFVRALANDTTGRGGPL